MSIVRRETAPGDNSTFVQDNTRAHPDIVEAWKNYQNDKPTFAYMSKRSSQTLYLTDLRELGLAERGFLDNCLVDNAGVGSINIPCVYLHVHDNVEEDHFNWILAFLNKASVKEVELILNGVCREQSNSASNHFIRSLLNADGANSVPSLNKVHWGSKFSFYPHTFLSCASQCQMIHSLTLDGDYMAWNYWYPNEVSFAFPSGDFLKSLKSFKLQKFPLRFEQLKGIINCLSSASKLERLTIEDDGGFGAGPSIEHCSFDRILKQLLCQHPSLKLLDLQIQHSMSWRSSPEDQSAESYFAFLKNHPSLEYLTLPEPPLGLRDEPGPVRRALVRHSFSNATLEKIEFWDSHQNATIRKTKIDEDGFKVFCCSLRHDLSVELGLVCETIQFYQPKERMKIIDLKVDLNEQSNLRMLFAALEEYKYLLKLDLDLDLFQVDDVSSFCPQSQLKEASLRLNISSSGPLQGPLAVASHILQEQARSLERSRFFFGSGLFLESPSENALDFQSDDAFQKFLATLKDCSALQYLSIYDGKHPRNTISRTMSFLHTIVSMENLTHLEAEGSFDATSIATFIPLLKNIRELSFSFGGPGFAGFGSSPVTAELARTFVTAIAKNVSIQSLNIYQIEHHFSCVHRRQIESILLRNKLLSKAKMVLLGIQNEETAVNSLPIPQMIQKFGSNSGEGTPLFSFLRANADVVFQSESFGCLEKRAAGGK